ncbi:MULTISPECIES: hypothetical protein [Acinetobacter]|nr:MULTISPECIES: hypothetical protein [Acinetobacter]MCW8037797.1 hypothetical protein [Acinetobacter entericus]
MHMKIIYKTLALGLTAITLTACQSAPRAYNGQSGYQIESQTADSATLAYTLAGRQNQQLDANKLQRACQKVLGINKTFKLSILSINEIANPAAAQTEQFGRQIGNSRASFGLSNTPDLRNSDNLGAQQALDARPATLRVVRYTCS